MLPPVWTGPSSNEEGLSQTHLDDLMDPLRNEISESIQQQERLLGEMQERHQDFESARLQLLGRRRQGAQGQVSDNERTAFLQRISAGADAFGEVLGNLKEGTKFYRDYLNVVKKFQQEVQDYCFARKTEKDELLRDLPSVQPKK